MEDPLAPPTDSPAAVESTPVLPPELIYRILELALPPVRLETFPERYNLLGQFALVSKIWSALAQAELWRHLYIDTRHSYDVLEAAISTSLGKEDARRAVSVRLGSSVRWEIMDLERLVSKLPGCEEVWLCGGEPDPSPRTLAGRCLFASRLKRVHLDILALQPSPTAATLPFLTELSISDPLDSATWFAFLARTELPALRSLALCNWYMPLLDPDQPIEDLSTRLGPRLTRFVLTTHAEITAMFDWSKFSSLDALALAISHDLSAILRRLPSRLRYLRLFPGEEGTEGLFDMLKTWPSALSTLRRLSLPRETFTRQSQKRVALACDSMLWSIVRVLSGRLPTGTTGRMLRCIHKVAVDGREDTCERRDADDRQSMRNGSHMSRLRRLR